MPPGLDVLTRQLKESFQRAFDRVQQNQQSVYPALFPKAMRMERAFVRAGGLLIAGTDPTGAGGVVAGYSDQRQVELLVEEGFTPLEAISIATLNGAKFMGREARIGSVAPGKQADLSRCGQSRGDDCRHPEDRDGVQERRRLRSGQTHRIGPRTSGHLVGRVGRVGRPGRVGRVGQVGRTGRAGRASRAVEYRVGPPCE